MSNTQEKGSFTSTDSTEDNSSISNSYFTTRDLVVIALLSSLGGVMSTFIGYLGNLINQLLGVPFGAGQFISGLHVFWIILGYGAIRKTGSGTALGAMKGVIELLTGSTHGIIVVIVTLIEGIIIDLGFLPLDFRKTHKRALTLFHISIVAGISALSNVIVFQMFYLISIPVTFLFVMCSLAFSSGILFGGYLSWSTLQTIQESHLFEDTFKVTVSMSKIKKPSNILLTKIVAVVFILGLFFGSTYYFVFIFKSFDVDAECEITGKVEHPYLFKMEDFNEQLITIEAELIGSVTHEDPKNYTGVIVSLILSEANPLPDAEEIVFYANDGYEISFNLQEIMTDSEFIIIEENNSLRLIAENYDGEM
ncbi:MAG: ECF transporter S component, partial [Candidatus Kariarchaeaceae archaeon]